MDPAGAYGYTAGIINPAQFSVLVTVVVLTAVVPTAIAQRFFSPPVTPAEPAATQAPAVDRPADTGSPNGRTSSAEPIEGQPEQHR